MKKKMILFIAVSSFEVMIHASWLSDWRNFFSSQPTAKAQAQPKGQMQASIQASQIAQPALSEPEKIALELRHFDSLDLENKKGLLELELRHLQSQNLADQIEELNKEIEEKQQKLKKLQFSLERQIALQGKLRQVNQNITEQERLRQSLRNRSNQDDN